MALAYGTRTEAVGAVAGGPYSSVASFNHNNGGDGLLMVLVSGNRDTSTPVDPSVTYNGVTVPQFLNAPNNASLASSPDCAVYLLESPASGSNAVVVTFDNDNNSYVVWAQAVSGFKSGDLTGSNTSTITDAGGASGSSHTFDTVADGSDMVMLHDGRDPEDHAPLSPGTGVTEQQETQTADGSNSELVAGFYTKTVATAGTDTIDCTASAADRRSSLAFELKIATGAPTGRIMSSLAASGGLAYKGGIAGPGGGLAG